MKDKLNKLQQYEITFGNSVDVMVKLSDVMELFNNGGK